MRDRILTHTASTTEKAKALRKRMTFPEQWLWLHVRANKMGVHFRRQVPFGPYIHDFFCVRQRIVIEIDGSQHQTDEAVEYDHHRDEYLRSFGFSVLRFSNKECLHDCISVLSKIKSVIAKSLQESAIER
jgi:very-short-patch-repair endonuclease